MLNKQFTIISLIYFYLENIRIILNNIDTISETINFYILQ